MGLPANLEPLAMLYETYPLVPYAVMVRVKSTGTLCAWAGGSLSTLDQRKATAALEHMETENREVTP